MRYLVDTNVVLRFTNRQDPIHSGIRSAIRMLHTIPTVADPSLGYIVVVPQSERAPHMVVVKGDNRYYGRTASGNTPLSEGDVARLYKRSRRWEVDRNALLANEVARAPFPPNPNFAYLHLIAQPVARSANLLERRLRPGETLLGILHDTVQSISDPTVFPRHYELDYRAPSRWLHRAEGYLGLLDGERAADDPEAAGALISRWISTAPRISSVAEPQSEETMYSRRFPSWSREIQHAFSRSLEPCTPEYGISAWLISALL